MLHFFVIIQAQMMLGLVTPQMVCFCFSFEPEGPVVSLALHNDLCFVQIADADGKEPTALKLLATTFFSPQ
jgi:hypothetical protein